VTAHPGVGPFPPGRISRMLRDTATRAPQAVALRDGARAVTYRELDGWADAVVAGLAARPEALGPGAVAVPLELGMATAAVYYGLLRAGRVVVPVNPLMPAPRLAAVLAESGAGGLLAGPRFLRRLAEGPVPPPARLRLASWDDLGVAGPPPAVGAPVDEPDVDDDAPAAVLFTSGTTGRPKMVQVSHRAVKANAWQMSGAHRIDARAVVLCHLPILNPMHTNACVLRGATQVLCHDDDLAACLGLAAEQGVTHYYTQPVRLDRLALEPQLAGLPLPTIRYLAAGSRAVAEEVTERLRSRGCHVFQGYGQTETCYLSHSDVPESPVAGSVGFGLAGTRTRVVDLDGGEPLPAGVLGELQLQGPQLMDGYLNRPDLQPFTPDGWFRTGDVARLDGDGRVFVLDRLVDVVVRDGTIVSPSRIERLLERCPQVREAGVVAVERDGQVEVVAFAVAARPDGDAGGEPDWEPVRQGYNATAAAGFAVDRIVGVDELPRMPVNGKVDRKVLRGRLDRAPGPAGVPA